MPIFDKELNDNTSSREFPIPNMSLGTPELYNPDLNMDMPSIGVNTTITGRKPFSRLSELNEMKLEGFEVPFSFVDQQTLEDNKKYPMYERGVDLENVYGLQQSGLGKLANGLAKGGVRMVGTFAQSFTNIPNIIDAIKKEDFSQLSGDPDGFEGSVDNWVENMETYFPNFYTRRENESPWIAAIPFAPGSGNFWGDKVIKNLGFTAGAIAGAVAQDFIVGTATAGIGSIPLLSAQGATVASKIGMLGLNINKIFSVAKKGDALADVLTGLNLTEKGLASITNAARTAQYLKITNGFKYGTTLIGSAMTEAGVEAREGYRTVKDALLSEYKLKNYGEAPIGEELEEIEKYATDAMNVRFGINSAILLASNAIMFDNLFKSLGKAEAGVVTGNRVLNKKIGDAGRISLKEGSINEFEKKAITGIGNKVWEFAKPKLPTIFSEGVYEEGGQFATEIGTYDYYTRKYKNLNNTNNKETWNTLNEIIKSTGQGFHEQFATEEGLQNMFIGALSALLMTGGQSLVDKKRGNGKNDRLNKTIELLNGDLLTGILQNKYEDTATSMAIAKDMKEATETGNLLKYKNLQNDLLFTMVNNRSKAGMHDVTIEQLNMLRDLSEEEFQKHFGMDFSTENKKTVGAYVDSLIDRANKMDKTISKLNEMYVNPFAFVKNTTSSEDRQQNRLYVTFEGWKDELAYTRNILDYSDILSEDISEKIIADFPALSIDVLKDITSKEGLASYAEEYALDANMLQDSINETTTAVERRKIREKVKLLQSLSSKANLLASSISESVTEDYFRDILSYEYNGRNFDNNNNNVKLSREDSIQLLFNGVDLNINTERKQKFSNKLEALSSKEGFEKYIEQEEKVRNQEIPEEGTINYTNEDNKDVPLELNREYAIDKTSEVSYKKIDNKRFEITLPSGKKIYTTTEAQAKVEVDAANKSIANMAKVRVLSINKNGSVTVEDINGDVFDILPERLKGYTRLATSQEQLQKQEEEIKSLQEEIETTSGSIASIPTATVGSFDGEGRRKSANILFTSSTTASVDWTTTVAPHITRSFVFLENIENHPNRKNVRALLITSKHEKETGLEGITSLSYPTSSAEAESTNVEEGFMAQVYVIKEGKSYYFLDEKGNKLNKVGTKADLSKVVFQTMPTTKLTWANGEAIYRKEEKAKAEEQAKRWSAFRENYFKDGVKPLILPFSISRGIAIEGDVNFRGHISTVFLEEDKIATQQGLIVIPTNSSVTYQDQTLAAPNGVPMIVYKDKLEYLYNRTFNKKEALTIFKVLEAFSEELLAQAKKGGKISKLGDYSTYLQNILYWKSKGEIGNNQIKIDLKTMSIVIGKESYPISDISSLQKEITEQLSTTYSSVNNSTLTKEFSTPFLEFYIKDDKLETRKWENYQSYLLSSKNPDGTSRSIEDTPLTTKVLAPTESVPYSFKQKYATLEMEELLPVLEKPKPEVKKTDNSKKDEITFEVNDWKVGGDVENTYKFNSGATIKFKVNITEGVPVIEFITDAESTANLKVVAANAETVQAATNILKSVNVKGVDFDDDINVITSFVKMKIESTVSLELKRIEEEKANEVKEKEEIVNDEDNNETPIEPLDPKDFTNAKTMIKRYFRSKTKIGDKISVIFYKESDNIIQGELVDYYGEIGVLFEGEDSPQIWEVELYLENIKVPKARINSTGNNNTGPIRTRLFSDKDKSDRMTDEDITLFKEWAAINVPNIPFVILERLVSLNSNEKAWGVFEDGVVKFAKGGLRGTEYHEVGHAIFNGILSLEQQQAIIEQEKERSGSFKDRASGKTIKYDEATDKQIEERIMDEFADFRLGKLPIRNLTDLVKYLYKAILDFVYYFGRKITGKEISLKEQMFKDINEGKFKESTPIILKDSYYSAAPGLTDQETHEYVQDLSALAATILFGEDKKNIFNLQSVNAKDLFDKMEEIYDSEDIGDNISKREVISDEAWEDLIKRTKQSIRVLHSINFEEEQERVTINDENANKNEYTDSPFSLDVKKSSTWPIKFTVSSLYETEPKSSTGLTIALPEFSKSSVGGVNLLNFSKTFATLLDKLSNTSSVEKAVGKLEKLVKSDSNYDRLFRRLGGKIIEDVDGEIKAYIDYASFDEYDWRLFIQFYQTFTRQHPNAVVQFKNGSEVYSASINEYSTARELKLSWIDKIKLLSESENSFIFYDNQSKTYRVKPITLVPEETPTGTWKVYTREGERKEFKTEKEASLFAKQNSIKIRAIADNVSFLNSIGINYSVKDVQKMSKKDRATFLEATSAIHKHLSDNSDIITLSGKTLGINGPLDILSTLYVKAVNSNKDSTHYGIDGKRRGNYSESNSTSILEDEFNESETLEELLETRPELNDSFSKGSLILKKGGKFYDKNGKRIKELKVEYIQGTKNNITNDSTTSSELNIGERFVQELNMNIDGKYYIIIPADSSTEWMLDFGLFFQYKDLLKNKWKTILPVFTDYLLDDIRLALESDKRDYVKNIKNNGAKELRFFKEILSKEMLNHIDTRIKENATYEELEEYVQSKQTELQAAVESVIGGMRENLHSTLINNQQVYMNDEDTFTFNSLDSIFSTKNEIDNFNMSKTELDNTYDLVIINQVIANIEMHKILFGDPAQFKNDKGLLDETKRIKSFLSPRKKTFDTPQYNTFLNQKYNKVNDIKLTPKDYGYHEYKPYANVIVFSDVSIAGSLSNTLSDYARTNETDGMSWIMDRAYKEVLLKNGQWSDEAEEWHQWQMAYTRQHIPGYKYTNKFLKKLDERLLKTTPPKFKLKVLKPIVSGTEYNSTHIKLNLHKMAQMPVYFSMVEGTTMEKLYIKMFEEKADYGVVESGAKVGVEDTHELYNKNGTFNTDVFNNNLKVSWKSYGIQVETESEDNKKQTRGSQITKMASMNLFNNGVPVSQEALDAYLENTALLDSLHENAYKALLKKLGVVENNGEFFLLDGKAVSETLMYELLRRESSDNLKDALSLGEDNQFKIPLEAAPSYINIRDIMYSLIDKSLIRPKMSGGAHVQVPVTMFEKAIDGRSLLQKTEAGGWKKITRKQYETLSDKEKESVVLSDDTLKFYEDEDGKRYMEILVPHWFKNKFGKGKTDEEILSLINKSTDAEEILKGIGFRIPSQALSSIEVFKVKGFLPQYMGSTVVVPSEITTKAGSDFDIDKLNMYLKSVYINENGKVKLVKYFGTEEATKEFYSELYSKLIEKQVAELVKKDEFKNKILNILDKYENSEEDQDPSDFLTEEELLFGIQFESLIELIEEQSEKEGMFASEYIQEQIKRNQGRTDALLLKYINEDLRETYVNKFYTLALENAYYSSLERLITIEENYKHLISPVSDGGFKAIAKKIDNLKGIDESGIKNKLIDRNYLTNLRSQFILAKRWIGIAAVNITNLSLRQKTAIYLDPNRIRLLSNYDARFLGDGSIQIQHNKTIVDGKELASISSVMTNDGKYFISDRLSGFATATVDVAKDPYILKVFGSDLVIGTAMFLESIGAGETGIMFLNQPIITEYLKMLDGRNQKTLYNMGNIEEIYEKFPVSDTFDINEKIDFSKLESNIESFYKNKEGNSIQENEQQRLILEEFLKYSKMARNLFNFSQSTNYDTASFRNGETLFRKQIQTQLSEETNLFNSVNKVLESTFIGKQERYIDASVKAIGTIFKLDSAIIKNITNSVLRPYADNPYLSRTDFDKIIQNVKIGMLDYILQTNLKLDASKVKELLVTPETAVATRLLEAQTKYGNDLPILKDFRVVSSKNQQGFKSLKLEVNVRDAYDENYYTGLMRQVRDFNLETKKLYKDLILVAILQGTKTSNISFKKIIPLEDYAEIVAPIVDRISKIGLPQTEIFTKGMFLRNHFTDNSLVPIYEGKKLFINTNSPVIDETTGNLTERYYSPKFPIIKPLGVTGIDRSILLLSEQYDSKYTSNDLIKISRTVKQYGPKGNTGLYGTNYIDFATGDSISMQQVIHNKLKGDYSLFTYYGYQKVKLPDGSPLMSYDGVGNGHFVYKLVNLYGEGSLGNEYYKDFESSVASNGTFIVENEIPDSVLIDYFGSFTKPKQDNTQHFTEKKRNSFVDNTTNSWGRLKDVPVYSSEGVNVMRTTKREAEYKHFGNPFSENKKLTHLINKPSIKEAVEAYKQWVLGNEQYKDVNPLQRDWIIEQIKEGNLDSKKFLYMNDKGNYYSHANALAEIVNNNLINKEQGKTTTEGAVVRLSPEARISRASLQKNPDTLFVFGDNDIRTGLGGVAKAMRGEPNAIGISTKKQPARNNEAYKSDAELEANKKIITQDINKAIAAWDTGNYVRLVIPQMGVGLAELDVRAPETFAFLQKELQRLENYVNRSPSVVKNNSVSLPIKSERITKQDIKLAINEVEKGVLHWNKDVNSPRIDLGGISRNDITKAEKDIKAGKLETVPAKRVIKALKEARERGYYDYMQGAGGLINKVQVEITPYVENMNQLTFFDSKGNPVLEEDSWKTIDNEENDENCEVPF